MQIIASWGSEEVAVEVDEECRSLAALKRALGSALPEEVDLEKVCLEACGRTLEDQDVVALEGGSVIDVSPTLAARATDALRGEGHAIGINAFLSAATGGDLRLCALYLDAGVACPSDTETPLHVACREGHVALCALLLDRGCDAGVKNGAGETPLHAAVEVSSTELCTLLLDRGGDTGSQDACGYTPLHASVNFVDAELCTLFLKRGVDANARHETGRTALHEAVKTGSAELSTILITHGADVGAKDDATHLFTRLSAEKTQSFASFCSTRGERI